MKKLTKFFVAAAVITLLAGSAHGAIEWHAWAVHDGWIDASSAPAALTANTGNDEYYHWNKSDWPTRTGQKAFYSTNAFNGRKVASIQTVQWTLVAGYWGNAYFNVMVMDTQGKKAILAPAKNSATSTGWDTDASDDGGQKPYCVFEAQPGWTGTAQTGWYAANWDEVKNLLITDGPFTEFPDTLGGAATMQNDPVYTAANWAAWADLWADKDLGWEKDGFLITFGQSTGTSTPVTTIANINVGPEPAPCQTIQSGTILYSPGHYLAGEPLITGHDVFGYNYQAHKFNGSYYNYNTAGLPPYEGDDDVYYQRLVDEGFAGTIDEATALMAAKPTWAYRAVDLIMKWNDAWLSNKDCDGDGKLDRYFGFPSYLGSGAWLTNHMSGSYEIEINGKSKTAHWNYFVKIVAAPIDATLNNQVWYNSTGVQIGPAIWGSFAEIQTVENDPFAGIHGKQYGSPASPGFGTYAPGK
ncbi:MAG: hypothetical protein JSU94_14790 [Phycisphaerales bacterium]|nr:MAG: hypothetical protein JSU94_14790 [Phycisphaerales bacterium]